MLPIVLRQGRSGRYRQSSGRFLSAHIEGVLSLPLFRHIAESDKFGQVVTQGSLTPVALGLLGVGRQIGLISRLHPTEQSDLPGVKFFRNLARRRPGSERQADSAGLLLPHRFRQALAPELLNYLAGSAP